MISFRFSFIALLAASFAIPALAAENAYPSNPVRVVSPFSAGGTNDYLARLSSKILTDALGGQFVVEQRTGSGGMIGSNVVAKSKPDGYTLLMGSISTHAIAPAVFKDPPFDARKDFTPISVVANVPLVLVVNPKSSFTTAKQLIAAAKAHPGTLTYGTPGNGAVPHLASALFGHVTKTDFIHVPYRGESVALNDLLGGQIDMAFANLPGVIGHIQAGTLRPLLVSSKTRASAIPDVPTAAEAGVDGFEVDAWYALLGPAGMPAPLVKKIADAVAEGIRTPEATKLVRGQGAEPVGSSPAEFAAFLTAEQGKWAKVVAEAEVTVQ